LHFNEIFDREELYQLYPCKDYLGEKSPRTPLHLRGGFLFATGIGFDYFERCYLEGSKIKSTKLTKKFDYSAFQRYYGKTAIPLFLISENNLLTVLTTDRKIDPKPGHTIIALIEKTQHEERVR